MVLGSRDDESTAVRILEAGADDYLCEVGYAESHRLLRVTMNRLRRKIGADTHRGVSIQADGGSGYRLAMEATAIGLAG